MKQTTGRKSRAWFWVGVALLSISALFWLAIISIIVDDPQDIMDSILAGILVTAIPIIGENRVAEKGQRRTARGTLQTQKLVLSI